MLALYSTLHTHPPLRPLPLFPGQEEFDAMTKAYYRGAVACIVAFSTTDRESFGAVEKWINKVENECGTIPMVLVQNKIDLIERAGSLRFAFAGLCTALPAAHLLS